MKKIIFVLALFFVFPFVLHAQTSPFEFNNSVALNMVKIEIPAPIETTRAQLGGVQGKLNVDLDDLYKTNGSIEVDLSGIRSHSFEDESKNAKQTEHMKNWFEIGPEVKPDLVQKNRWAKFVITKIVSAEPASLAKAQAFSDEIGTGRRFQVTAEGDFTVHQITKPKKINLDLVIYDVKPGGPRYAQASRVLLLKTREPFTVSLKEHQVQPRDTTGKFLAGALKVVGLKISDTAQVSLDLRPYQLR